MNSSVTPIRFKGAEQTPAPAAPLAQIDRPSKAGEWSIDQIISALSRDIPSWLTKSKTQGGANISFIPWYRVSRLLDKYAIGWSWQITNTQLSSDRIFISGQLTIPALEGPVSREAMGTELLKVEKPIRIEGEGRSKQYLRDSVTNRPIMELQEIPYGDPSSNAESMAFRRAAARFGLALSHYDDPTKMPRGFYQSF